MNEICTNDGCPMRFECKRFWNTASETKNTVWFEYEERYDGVLSCKGLILKEGVMDD